MQFFTILYTVIGGLGIFFYGMKSMSEALQSIAGDMIKNIINTLTTNRISAVLVGTFVTMLVQSSSVSTVMVIGFVNAGLMQITQAIGVIFGANIGTTITGWIISIKVGKYGLLLIGIGIFPLLFGKTNKTRQAGRFLFAIGMVFFGLSIMSNAFKPLRSMPEFLNSISYFSEQNYSSYLASIFIGCLLTMIIQSSSAMLGITIALAVSGVIQFHTAAALVLGENIGTTITALLASVGGNVHSKRAARAHAIFNCLGVVIIFSIFPKYIQLIDWIVPGDPAFLNIDGEYSKIAVHIATSHTIFNVSATLIFLPFINYLSKLVIKITPEKSTPEQFHLIVLGNPQGSIPATAIVQAKQVVIKMNEIIYRMFDRALELFENKKPKNQTDIIAKINDYEQITDNMQKEVTIFLTKIATERLSEKQSEEIHSLIRIADELESIGDYIARLVFYTNRTKIEMVLVDEAKEEFFNFFKEVENYYKDITSHLKQFDCLDTSVYDRKNNELHTKSESIREHHLSRISQRQYDPLAALTFSDMIVALRKIRSHAHNISQAFPKM